MKNPNANSLRIIGGKWRGRRLSFPAAAGLRPTHDRIRETLFNWLMQDIHGANCLDLFAGSGALGMEALSRGATHVTFVESQREVCQSLKHNLKQCAAANATVIHSDFCHLTAAQLQPPFDIVFVDPPFKTGLAAKAIQWLIENHVLAANARIYLETEKDGMNVVLPENWHQSRHKSTSTIDYYLFDHKTV